MGASRKKQAASLASVFLLSRSHPFNNATISPKHKLFFLLLYDGLQYHRCKSQYQQGKIYKKRKPTRIYISVVFISRSPNSEKRHLSILQSTWWIFSRLQILSFYRAVLNLNSFLVKSRCETPNLNASSVCLTTILKRYNIMIWLSTNGDPVNLHLLFVKVGNIYWLCLCKNVNGL